MSTQLKNKTQYIFHEMRKRMQFAQLDKIEEFFTVLIDPKNKKYIFKAVDGDEDDKETIKIGDLIKKTYPLSKQYDSLWLGEQYRSYSDDIKYLTYYFDENDFKRIDWSFLAYLALCEMGFKQFSLLNEIAYLIEKVGNGFKLEKYMLELFLMDVNQIVNATSRLSAIHQFINKPPVDKNFLTHGVPIEEYDLSHVEIFQKAKKHGHALLLITQSLDDFTNKGK